MVNLGLLGIVIKMSVEYYVVELNNNFSDDEAVTANVTAKIAEVFSIDPRKANLLLSRAPGAITKPIPRAEAELIAARFRRAGLKVILKKLDSSDNPDSTNSGARHSQDIPNNISLPKRQTLESTISQSPAILSKSKSSLKLRLLGTSLVACLAIAALFLFFFLISSASPEQTEIKNWQSHLPLILASIFALTVALPIFYISYKSYRQIN